MFHDFIASHFSKTQSKQKLRVTEQPFKNNGKGVRYKTLYFYKITHHKKHIVNSTFTQQNP